MASIDRASLYSTSTLVGGGEREEEEEERQTAAALLRHSLETRQWQVEHQQQPPWQLSLEGSNRGRGSGGGGGGGADHSNVSGSDYHSHDGIDWTELGDRVVGGITASRRGSYSTLRAQPPTVSGNNDVNTPHSLPRIVPPSDDEDEGAEDANLHVPWWSAILPNPVMMRRKSNSPSSPAPDPTTSSSSSSSSSPPPSSSAAGVATANRHVPQPTTTAAQHLGVTDTSRSEQPASLLPPSIDPDSTATFAPDPPSLPHSYPLYTSCYCEENAYLLAAYLNRICQRRNYEGGREGQMRWAVDVVVVSNKSQTVAMWQQIAGSSAEMGYQVVWDYHVFVVVSCQEIRGAKGEESPPAAATTSSLAVSTPPPLRRARSLLFSKRGSGVDEESRTASWVYDLDSRLPTPTPLTAYLASTFGIDRNKADTLPKRFRLSFRVVSSCKYFTRFGSNRSHMKRITGARLGDSFEWLSPRPEWDLILGPKVAIPSPNNYFMDTFVDMRVRIGDGRFGVIVKLEDLAAGMGLMSDKTDCPEEEVLAEGVAVLLHSVPSEEAGFDDDEGEENGQGAQGEETRQEAETSKAAALYDDEQERTSGVVIGGIQRYGIRPPPPPPDGAVIPPNRGKRIMDPLYPAYILSAFENRVAKERSSAVRFDDSHSSTP